MINSDAEKLKIYFQDRPFKKGTISIVDYAETTYLPSGKFRGVKFSHKRAPYLKEPLSLLSPESEYQEVRCQFPAQTGKSTIAEMLIEYYIAEYPSEILYVSSNETAAIKFMQRRIEPRCALKGIEFRADVDSKSARRTGDTAYSKSFNGGNLDVASSLSPAQLASETKRIVVGDEIDRWKLSISAEGNPLDILYARTQAWGDEKKILLISTPTLDDVSVMNQLYLDGDQRLFYVPCPHCGEMQILDFFEGNGFGLKWENKSGGVEKKSIVYICKSCQKEIKESKKSFMLNGGEWRATTKSSREHVASFHVNGLYSPFLSWYDMAVSFNDAINDPIKKQAHENLKMGRVFKPIGTKPKISKVSENRGDYHKGEVPDGVLYLTAGIDLQEGSKLNPDNPPRLEMQVIGTGINNQIKVIDYQIFEGPVEYPDYGAWEILKNYAMKNNLTYYRKSDNFPFPVNMVFIDSGDLTNVVYDFCSGWQNTYAIKGRNEIKKKKSIKDSYIDEEHQGNILKYKYSKTDEDNFLYLINTNFYKNRIYIDLNIERQQGEQRRGFIEFYNEIPDRYFEQLLSEDKMADGSYNSHGRRNEALDTLVYARCAADVYLNTMIKDRKYLLRQQGYNERQTEQMVNSIIILEELKKATEKKVKKN